MRKPPLSPFLFDLQTLTPGAEPCADHAPGPRPVMDLDAPELFLVSAVRAWVAPLMRPGAPHPDWRDIFAMAGVASSGAMAFEMMMSVLSAHAQRLIDVHCCRCPSLGEDEAAAIRLVSALQRQDMLPALDVLGDWLAADAVGPALQAARRLGAAMVEAGLRLPHRGQVIPFPTSARVH